MVNREDCWIVKLTMVLIVMMSVAHHTSADLATLLQLTATSVIERPERAALEPPTVTSLKPPDRSKSNRGGGGISVQSEQSGGHIPPVVASRSPSSSSFSRNYNSRYLHHNPRSNQPAAPVATASSGSRSGHHGIIEGRRDTSDNHQVVPIPTPHLVNGTSVSIPQDSSWVPPVSFAPLPPPPPPPPRNTHISSGYAPIAGSYPKHSRIPVESETFEPKHQDRSHGEPDLPNVGGGVWGESDSSSAEGMWQETRRRPAYPQDHLRPFEHSFTEDNVRSDTFGHQISEDLSHVSSEYSPRRGHSRRGQIQPPGQNSEFFHPLRNSHPSGRNIHRIDHHHLSEDDTLDFRSKDNSDPKVPTESGDSVSTSHGPSLHGEKTQNAPVHPRLYASNVDRGDTHKPLTLYEVWHMVNMSNWEEFVNFLKRKGLNMSQVLNYMNEGATKQDFLILFAKPDVSSTNEASSSSSPSDINHTSTKDSDGLYGESFLHAVTDSGRFLRTTTSGKVQEDSDVDGDDEDEENDEENKSAAPKGKRENKRKGKNKRNKGRNGEKNKRKRGRNHDKPVVPDFTYTTVIFPVDNIQHNDTQSSKVESFATDLPTTPLFQGQSTKSVPSQQSTRLTIPEYSPDWDLSAERAEVDSIVPDLSSWPQSSFISPTTPMKAILPPRATTPVTPTYEEALPPIHRASGLDRAAKTTSLPLSKGPVSGSMTLPPTSKPSEVSIISFTVMEVPFKVVPEETALEDIKPLKREKNHRSPPRTTVESFPKRTYSSTKLLPTLTSNKMNDDPVVITPHMREESKDKYTFPVKGFMIITGIMGALAVFTLVVLISYAIIKCSKQPVVNNYQVSEQKTSATQQS